MKELFHLDTVFENRHSLTRLLAADRTVGAYTISGYEGTAQLIDNIIFGYKGNLLALRFTPLVLDLGRKHIKTSSVKWGSFFNMANMSHIDKPDQKLTHQTAWLGGYLANKGALDGNHDWERVAEDGFLVFPQEDGSIKKSAQLFGTEVEVDEKTYANGCAV